MAKFRLTNKAVNDLTQIWNYTYDVWSEVQADKYYQMLLYNCSVAANNPEIGKKYSVIMDSLLGFRAGRHIIFYCKVAVDEIEIIRILHGQMDLKHRLKEK